MCYYPKTGIKKAIKSALTPRGDWDLHVVKRLSHKEITSYQTARDKERKAMYTSEVDSENTHTANRQNQYYHVTASVRSGTCSHRNQNQNAEWVSSIAFNIIAS